MGSSIKTGEVFPGRIGDYQKGGSEVKRGVLAVILSIAITVPCYGMTCHELAMSYIIHDQDKPKEAGDKFYTDENEPNPMLCETTAYFEGTHGSHGDRMREGYAAGAPEMYGDAVMVYEAVKQDDGTYRIGEYIDTFEIKDTGYGYSTGQGKSSVRSDKRYEGTIEGGIHIDVYKTNYKNCKEWMKLTNGKIFAVIVEGKG